MNSEIKAYYKKLDSVAVISRACVFLKPATLN